MIMFRILFITIFSCFLTAFSCTRGDLSSAYLRSQTGSEKGVLAGIARLMQPQIAETEARIAKLQGKIQQLELPSAPTMNGNRGFRGVLGGNASRGEPTLTIDLLHSQRIDSVYLVPAVPESGIVKDLLPRRLSLETATEPRFDQPQVIARNSRIDDRTVQGSPMHYRCGSNGRYVRLTIHEGAPFAGTEQFALSEIVVIADGNPISFNCPVQTSHGLDVQGVWHAQALTDGVMPLGIWQDGSRRSPTHHDDCIEGNDVDTAAGWDMRLAATSPIDRLVLFPCRAKSMPGACLMPASIDVWLHRENTDQFPVKLVQWQNPGPGYDHGFPLVLPISGAVADRISLVSKPAPATDGRWVHALSEIEVWSQGVNLAHGNEVTFQYGDHEQRINSLTDGHGPDGKILPVGEWLERHREYGRLRVEFDRLIPLHRAMINRAEVHALWACSVVLGLLAATPLLIAHQRRMIPKKEVERIRKRIASDLHDDVGSNLGSISLIARVAKNHLDKSGTDSAVRHDLDELESIARESSLAMRDIVWLVEQDRDSVDDLIIKLRDLCNRLLCGIDVSFDCADCGTASKLSPDAKRDLFLFCKEAFHNILKHARATQVRIRLWDEGDQLALEISDNGVGMPLKDRDDTGRISKLTARAEALKAHMHIKSSRENGTRIRLHVRRNPIIPRIPKLNLILS
jgi:signal transduction histidine kinase